MPNSAKYAVIFVSQLTDQDSDGYAAMAERMESLARRQDGFVDFQSVHDESGKGISVSYWSSEEAIRRWAANLEHLEAQRIGRKTWYESFQISVAKIERNNDFERNASLCSSGLSPG